MNNTRYIFLDDERIPAYLKDGNESWEVYRTAEALLDDLPNILRSGDAVVFSLDHDLGEDILTGYDFVRMLVEMHMDGIYSLDFVRIQVHSANPVGAQNMRRLWDNFQRVIWAHQQPHDHVSIKEVNPNMEDYQVRTKKGALTFFKTHAEATAWAEKRWADIVKVSYTDEKGDRIVLYPESQKGVYTKKNLTEELNKIVRLTEQFDGYE